MLVDVVAEIDRAVPRDPAGDVDPGHRNPVRQVDDLEMAGRDSCIDGGAIPARRVLQNPGGQPLKLSGWRLCGGKSQGPSAFRCRMAPLFCLLRSELPILQKALR